MKGKIQNVDNWNKSQNNRYDSSRTLQFWSSKLRNWILCFHYLSAKSDFDHVTYVNLNHREILYITEKFLGQTHRNGRKNLFFCYRGKYIILFLNLAAISIHPKPWWRDYGEAGRKSALLQMIPLIIGHNEKRYLPKKPASLCLEIYIRKGMNILVVFI